jgi:hypothetical protein
MGRKVAQESLISRRPRVGKRILYNGFTDPVNWSVAYESGKVRKSQEKFA